MPTLRELRVAQALSQNELAWRANTSSTTVLRIERGYGSSLAVRQRLAKALGIEVDAIDWPASSPAIADPEKG